MRRHFRFYYRQRPLPGSNRRNFPCRRFTPRLPTCGERGSATAEYAIATLAAVGFAGLLVVILRSDVVRQMLTDLIHKALTVAG